MNGVVVITPTIGRLDLVRRCIESVRTQTYSGTIEHLIVGDHLPLPLAEKVMALCVDYGEPVHFMNYLDEPQAHYIPERIARVRNFGIQHSHACYVAHLDDDNTFDSNHIDSLVAILETDATVDIAFSWRRVLNEDGSPCALRRYPWVITTQAVLAKEVFSELESMGVFKLGSCIIRDPEPGGDDELFHVDSSEWLMRRTVFKTIQFVEHISPREKIYGNTDDYLFCRNAHRANLRFRCSQRVTLNYYLCGQSSATQRY